MVASRDTEGLGSRYSIIGYLASGKGSTGIVNKCILRKLVALLPIGLS